MLSIKFSNGIKSIKISLNLFGLNKALNSQTDGSNWHSLTSLKFKLFTLHWLWQWLHCGQLSVDP
jgi:hypothetical protein